MALFTASKKLGSLQLRLLGTYLGFLVNYAGVDLNITVVTVELASAGIMPSSQEISRMWVNMVRWLGNEIPRLPSKTTNNILQKNQS